MVNRKQIGTLSADGVRRLMAGACVLAGLGLGGCDAAFEATQNAKAKSAEGARYTASAGQPRATDKLYNTVAGEEQADLKSLEGTINGKVKSDPKSLSEWVVTNPMSKDLETAEAQIAQAIQAATSADVNPAIKSTLQAQSGATNLQLAGARLDAARQKLMTLMDKANALQGLTSLATQLGGEADAIAKVKMSATTNELANAPKDVQELQEKVKQADAAVKEIEGQIKAKQDEARRIYSETEAAFMAAENLKGQEAIDAVNKAGEARKAADQATADAGNLEPKLGGAQLTLQEWQLKLEKAQADVATANAAAESSEGTNKRNADRVTSLREQAKTLLNGKEGINERYKEITALADELEKDLESAKTAAGKAEGDFRTAASDLAAAKSAINTIVQDRQLESSDPLAKAAKEDRGVALLTWSQAAAAEQAGRVLASRYATGRLMNLLAAQVSTANKAGGMNSDAKGPGNVDPYKKEAIEKFQAAAEMASKAINGGSPDVKAIAWIGNGVLFLANQGLAGIADGPVATNAKKAAKDAYAEASKGEMLRGPLERDVLKVQ